MTTVEMPVELQKIMNQIWDEIVGREPNYRYFEDADKNMYCWTTEKDGSGNYYCWTYKAYGKGSRSGKPQHWKMVDKVRFAKRNKAKTRALARYEKNA